MLLGNLVVVTTVVNRSLGSGAILDGPSIM